jgi:hypothetical protein
MYVKLQLANALVWTIFPDLGHRFLRRGDVPDDEGHDGPPRKPVR